MVFSCLYLVWLSDANEILLALKNAPAYSQRLEGHSELSIKIMRYVSFCWQNKSKETADSGSFKGSAISVIN